MLLLIILCIICPPVGVALLSAYGIYLAGCVVWGIIEGLFGLDEKKL